MTIVFVEEEEEDGVEVGEEDGVGVGVVVMWKVEDQDIKEVESHLLLLIKIILFYLEDLERAIEGLHNTIVM